MASGAVVINILREMVPGTLSAQPGSRLGGSTPAERFPMWAFDASVDSYIDFLCQLEGYAGGGITITFWWSAASATSNVTRWAMAFRRFADDAEDADVSHTYDPNEVDDTAPSASGELSYPTLAFTDGADMDSVANGEVFVLRVFRNADHANDNMTGNAELWGFIGRET